MSSNDIIFWRYYDEDRAQHLWLTTTTVNKKMYFCKEVGCNEEAFLSLDHLCTAHYNRVCYPAPCVQCGERFDVASALDISRCHRCILSPCGCTAELHDGERGSCASYDESARDLAERFYLGSCYAETDEGYAAACRWFGGELGPIDEKTRASLLVTLRRWHFCSGDEPFCPQVTLESE
jgi:hypothetical protein